MAEEEKLTDEQDHKSTKMHELSHLIMMYTESSIELLRYTVAAFGISKASNDVRKLSDITGLSHIDDKHIWGSFFRVSKDARIIYKVAIFDSFLNSVTRYALAKRPEIAMRQAQIYAGQLLKKSRSELIQPLIDKKANALSRESFMARIKFIEEIIGSKFNIEYSCIERMKNISKKRNFIVHEVDALSYRIDDNLEVSRKEAYQQDTSLINAEITSLDVIVQEVYKSCVKELYGQDITPSVSRLFKALTREQSEDVD